MVLSEVTGEMEHIYWKEHAKQVIQRKLAFLSASLICISSVCHGNISLLYISSFGILFYTPLRVFQIYIDFCLCPYYIPSLKCKLLEGRCNFFSFSLFFSTIFPRHWYKVGTYLINISWIEFIWKRGNRSIYKVKSPFFSTVDLIDWWNIWEPEQIQSSAFLTWIKCFRKKHLAKRLIHFKGWNWPEMHLWSKQFDSQNA